MSQRVNPFGAHYDILKPLIDLGEGVQASGLERSLLELVKIRASQINGCAVCLAMHTRHARDNGETEERIYLLDGWRESPLYSDRERAALAWTEALTILTQSSASDDVYAEVARQFAPEEQVKLTMMIGIINSFNRINVGFRVKQGKAAQRKAA